MTPLPNRGAWLDAYETLVEALMQIGLVRPLGQDLPHDKVWPAPSSPRDLTSGSDTPHNESLSTVIVDLSGWVNELPASDSGWDAARNVAKGYVQICEEAADHINRGDLASARKLVEAVTGLTMDFVDQSDSLPDEVRESPLIERLMEMADTLRNVLRGLN